MALALGTSGAVLIGAAVWLFRVPLAGFVLRQYLAGQGVDSHIVIESIGFGGVAAHGALGRADNPDMAFERLAVTIEWHGWSPKIGEIDLEHPSLRLGIGPKGVSFGALQPLLQSNRPAATGGPGYISDNLTINVSQARIIAATPIGPVEFGGDVHLAGGKLKSLDLSGRPIHLQKGMTSLTIESARVKGVATQTGAAVHAVLSGAMTAAMPGNPLRVDRARLAVDVSELRWSTGSGFRARARSAVLSFDSEGPYRLGPPPTPASARIQFANLTAGMDQEGIRTSGEAVVTAHAALSPADAKSLIAGVSYLVSDRRSVAALMTAARDLTLTGHLVWRSAPQQTAIVFDGPMQLNGADQLSLHLSPAVGDTVRIGASGLESGVALDLSGGCVPNLALNVPEFTWRGASPQRGTFSIRSRFDVGAFRNIAIEGQGEIQLQDGVVEIRLPRCASVRIASWKLRRKAMASGASIAFCPAKDQPFFSTSQNGWALRGVAKDASTDIDIAGVKLTGVSGQVVVTGTQKGPPVAALDLAGTLSDNATTRRFAPLSLAGKIDLTNWIFQGRFIGAAGSNHVRIGTASFSHEMNSGRGRAAIDFPDIAFGNGALAPKDISPLLASLAEPNGSVRFAGQLAWSPKHMESGGRLDIEHLQFKSPLGVAEQLRTHIVFTSLLPPTTAPGQQIDITRVDWVSPLTAFKTLFTVASSNIRVDEAKTGFAGGTLSLTPTSVSLPAKGVKSEVSLSHLSLGTLVDISNIGSKVHMEGRVSGNVPFSVGPEGMRFNHGHIQADGPGRLRIDPSLWGAGEANAVQKVAYRALQNLAFSSLSADIDSEPAGRLRIVFHVKGYSDTPDTGKMKIGLLDLVQGRAFQNYIPLPQGTPVDLTLDASLNFDELLRGYESAWQQATGK